MLDGHAEHTRDVSIERHGLAQHERDEGLPMRQPLNAAASSWRVCKDCSAGCISSRSRKIVPLAVMIPAITRAVATRPTSFGSWGRIRLLGADPKTQVG